MNQENCQKGFVLHSRSYRESSLLLDIFTREHGKLSMISKGAKRGKAKKSTILQPFIPLSVSWVGRSDLLTLTQVEEKGPRYLLMARKMVCGLYMNELLVRLLHSADPHPELFDAFEIALKGLTENQDEQIVLRIFEKYLLSSIGYGLELTCDASTGEAIIPEANYYFNPEVGALLMDDNPNYEHYHIIVKGESLLALEAEQFESKLVLQQTKKIMRLCLAPHLGQKPLASRQLV